MTDAAPDINPAPAPSTALVRRSPFEQISDLARYLGAIDEVVNHLSKASILPRAMQTPANMKLVLLQGLEMGFTPIQAIRASFVIETKSEGAKVGYYVDSLVALVRSSGVCRFFRVDETTAGRCRVSCARKDEDESVVHTFELTMEQAKAAGLDKKNEWDPEARKLVQKQKYVWITAPADMLRARCSGRAVKSVFQDVVFGMATPEELDDLAAATDLERAPAFVPATVVTASASPAADTKRAAAPEVVDAELVEDRPPAAADTKAADEGSGDPAWDELLGIVAGLASVDTAGWLPDDLVKHWNGRIDAVRTRAQLNALSPLIAEATKRAPRSKTCGSVAATMRETFNAANAAIRKSEDAAKGARP